MFDQLIQRRFENTSPTRIATQQEGHQPIAEVA
jgi:hypothetical protein